MDFPYTIELSELPSKGLAYSGITKIQGRSITVREAKILRTILDTKDYYQIALTSNSILNNCFDFDYKKLTYGDKFFLLIWLRMNSLGKNFLVDYTCKHCKEKTQGLNVDLSQLTVKHIKEDYTHPMEFQFVESNGVKHSLILSLHNIEDEEKVINFTREAGVDLEMDEDIVARYASTVRVVDGREVSFEEAIKLMSVLPEGSKAISIIRRFFEIYDHGIDFNYEMECPKCKESSSVLVPFCTSLFIAPTISDYDFRESIVVKSENKQ